MTLLTAELTTDIIGMLLALVLIVITLPLIDKGRESMPMALFNFALVSFMLSLAYWVVYNAVRPDTRMPLAANEIGESAWFLLLAAVLDAVLRDEKVPLKPFETIFTLVFVIASVALWIAWTGEWVQDILGGIPFGYFLYTCVKALRQTDALREIEWRVLGIYCVAIIAGHVASLFITIGDKRPLDYYCTVLMFSILIWLLIKSFVSIKRNEDAKVSMALTFSTCAFGFSSLYMSSGWIYELILMLNYMTLPLMYITLKREVTE
ncbi:MAG: hypothetical protein IJH57_00665 [Mogibacterium sp.]|nr:hypothetical protein [Mogibacterium sp.]